MASLVLYSDIYHNLTPDQYTRCFTRPQCWGEYPQPDGALGGCRDAQFRQFRTNFRNCHIIDGCSPLQGPEDYFLPRPLAHDFGSRIISHHNTKRRIEPTFSFSVFPEIDYNRTDDTGNSVLTENTQAALHDKHNGLYHTSRYSRVFPDHSTHLDMVPGKLPPQHHHHRDINRMLKRNHLWDYQVVLPPFKQAETMFDKKRNEPNPEIPTPKQNRTTSFLKELKELQASTETYPVDKRRIAQMQYRTIKQPTMQYKRNYHARSNTPQPNGSKSAANESAVPRRTHHPSYNAFWQDLGPERWQFIDFESRRLSSRLENEQRNRYRDVCQTEPHLDLLRRKKLIAEREAAKQGPNQFPDPHIDQEEEEEEDEEDSKCSPKDKGCYCSPIYDPYAFKLLHKRGKFVSPWSSNLDPNFLCSKTESINRFHTLYPDYVPDQRDNYTYGKRVSFHGFNSSYFR